MGTRAQGIGLGFWCADDLTTSMRWGKWVGDFPFFSPYSFLPSLFIYLLVYIYISFLEVYEALSLVSVHAVIRVTTLI